MSVTECRQITCVPISHNPVEINAWWQTGQSCFSKLLKQMKLCPRPESILDQIIAAPDG